MKRLQIGVIVALIVLVSSATGLFLSQNQPIRTNPSSNSTTTQQTYPWVSTSNISNVGKLNSLYFREKKGELYAEALGTTQIGTIQIITRVLPNIDSKTFLVALNSTNPAFVYTKDRNGVYLIQIEGDAGGGGISIQPVSSADSSTFNVISYEYNNNFYSSYSADKYHVFDCDPSNLNGCYISQIPGADPMTFVVIQGNGFDAQDKNHKYYAGQKVN